MEVDVLLNFKQQYLLFQKGILLFSALVVSTCGAVNASNHMHLWCCNLIILM